MNSPRLNLYLLTYLDGGAFDTFDACVVAAESEAAARNIHPDGSTLKDKHYCADNAWPKDPNVIKVTYLGVAAIGIKPGVICASFAGE